MKTINWAYDSSKIWSFMSEQSILMFSITTYEKHLTTVLLSCSTFSQSICQLTAWSNPWSERSFNSDSLCSVSLISRALQNELLWVKLTQQMMRCTELPLWWSYYVSEVYDCCLMILFQVYSDSFFQLILHMTTYGGQTRHSLNVNFYILCFRIAPDFSQAAVTKWECWIQSMVCLLQLRNSSHMNCILQRACYRRSAWHISLTYRGSESV